MIFFWLICALMIVIALAFILPTLLEANPLSNDEEREQANIAVYRDQLGELEGDMRNGLISKEQFEQDRDEIERRLLEDVSGPVELKKSKKDRAATVDRRPVYAVAFGLPIIALALYVQVGNRAAIEGIPNSPFNAPRPESAASQPNDQKRIEGNVAALAKRLEQNPGDLAGWMMLANSYTTMGKYDEASAAYEKAAALKPDDANLLADYAFALAMKNGRRLSGQPNELLQKALKLDPDNPKVLQLAGSAAFEAKDYKKAIGYWQRVLQRAGSDPELNQAVSQKIAEAQKLSESK